MRAGGGVSGQTVDVHVKRHPLLRRAAVGSPAHGPGTDDLLEAAQRADCVYFGTLAQRSEVSRRTLGVVLDRAPRALRVLDVNLRKACFSRETVSASVSRANVIKLSEQEAPLVAEMVGLPAEMKSFCDAVIGRDAVRICVVTLGEKGAYAVSRHGESVFFPGFTVDVKDTVGAGDAFTGAFVHGLVSGLSLPESCELGCAAGAFVAAQSGGTQPMSDSDVQRFRRTARRRAAA